MTDSFKNAMRNTCRQVRERLSPNWQRKASSQICSRIKQLTEYRYAKRISLYHAINGEVDLNELWRAAPMQGKFCYFPAIKPDKTMLFLPATPATKFKKNQYNIPEPIVDLSTAAAPKKLDLIFMPLLAFDHHGTRLGMGEGYYDRTLAKENHPLLIGVAYGFQHQPYIPRQEWDIPLTAIITEQTIWWCR